MAYINVSTQTFDDKLIMDILYKGFDKVVLIDQYYDRVVFWVEHEDLPYTDDFITPCAMYFYGIEPFIISFGIPEK
jgi:hypothetical protein